MGTVTVCVHYPKKGNPNQHLGGDCRRITIVPLHRHLSLPGLLSKTLPQRKGMDSVVEACVQNTKECSLSYLHSSAGSIIYRRDIYQAGITQTIVS